MKAVFLDTETLGDGISYEELQKLPVKWSFFKKTKPEEILERIKDAQIVVSNKVFIGDILKQCPQLKLICIAATGYNNVDLTTATSLKIKVCNVPGYSTESVAQLVITFILALATNLTSYVQAVKAGAWQKHSQFCLLSYPIIELEGKKLGIIGYGALGKRVATLAQAFGMKLLIAEHSSSKKPIEGSVPLEQVLRDSDFITIHVPLTPKTQNLIQRKEIERMKSSAFLINTARGGIVNENDLAECLKERRIAGAAIDVLSKEPPREGNPLLDPNIPNLLLTPHIGWASLESRMRLIHILKENIDAFLHGVSKNLIS